MTAEAERTRTSRWQALPAWIRIGILYLVARLITTGMLAAASAMSGPRSRFGVSPGIGNLMLGWDAQWYWFTALNGYPTTLPLTDTGQVAENQWAFMPVYAYLAQIIGTPVGSWGVGAVLISLVAGYLCALVLHRIWRTRLEPDAAMWAVVFFVSAPLAALFEVGYAEALGLLWLVLILWCVVRRRYGWMYLLIPLFGFTRPGVLALALFLGLFGIWRFVRRRTEPLHAAEVVHIVVLAAWAAVVGFAWQVIAGLVTGDANAYLTTELAWRRNWLPDSTSAFAPFDGFLQGVAFWFSTWGLSATVAYVALAVLVVAIAALLIFEPHVRRVGVEVRLWSASYLVYLFAVFFPQSSIFRLLFPLSPLWGALAVPRSRAWRVVVLVCCLVGQSLWIYNMYALGDTYWRIP
ncbi:membrane protein [Microbacterium mangrovi]|uniref:Membrane protein n=1 Tax=Microbacterium mangrovi TaxID=1348253 RepID=A0A0B2A5Q5_9MICO|nr:membrane protein [Microbacterium mangrovi]